MKNLTLLLFLLFPSLALATVYTASDYVSIYGYQETYTYTDRNGADASLQYFGYHDQHNLDDPIIRCAQEYGACAFPAQYDVFNNVVNAVPRFKVYISPGTTSINTTVFTVNSAIYVAIARLGQPPTGDYTGYADGLTNDDLIKINTLGFTDVELKAGDCIATNKGGILSIAEGPVHSGNGTEGSWLYVIVQPIRGSIISDFVSNIVDAGPYMTWFRAASWDGNGDPVTSSPAPTPNGTPTGSPNASNGTPRSACRRPV